MKQKMYHAQCEQRSGARPAPPQSRRDACSRHYRTSYRRRARRLASHHPSRPPRVRRHGFMQLPDRPVIPRTRRPDGHGGAVSQQRVGPPALCERGQPITPNPPVPPLPPDARRVGRANARGSRHTGPWPACAHNRGTRRAGRRSRLHPPGRHGYRPIIPRCRVPRTVRGRCSNVSLHTLPRPPLGDHLAPGRVIAADQTSQKPSRAPLLHGALRRRQPQRL
jgi:hypothetical protein